jgi:methylenetetrahydrofolate--tRNA-(uracil-5-)-methyltransferase
MIPGLENAAFLRLGQIHRNTYINAPSTLLPTMAAKARPDLFFAGQLAGTEGYIENIASGLVAGLNAVQVARERAPLVFPRETAIGSLCHYISTPSKDFAPMNIHFGLLPAIELPPRISKADKQRLLCERALAAFTELAR